MRKIFLLCTAIVLLSSIFCFSQDSTLMDQEVQKHFTQAQAFIDVKNYKYALEEYRKIFPIDVDCLEAHKAYVDCMYEYKDKKLKEAFTFYQKQIKKDRDTTPAWYLGLGYCYLKTGNGTMALENCQKACDLLSGKDEKRELYEKYYKFSKEDNGIPVIRRVVIPPIIYQISIGSILLFIIVFFSVRYYLRKKILEKIIKLEGMFEVFNPRGFKIYVLDCTDKKLFQKYGDTIRVGSKKGCDIHLKIKDEEKVYAILEATKIEEHNMITVRTASEDVEMFLEVPKSRYTPDDMVKLPFKGSPLWDKDIINIKDYRIFYHNVKTGKRLWKDYPESAKGFLFVDPDTPQEVELPDMALLQSRLVPEEEEVYNPYKDISKTVKTIISSNDTNNNKSAYGEEEEYDFEPMDEKYIMETLPPLPSEGSDLLTYKTDEDDEEYYYDTDISLPEKNVDRRDDIILYPADNEEDVYEFEETSLPETEKREDVLSYPAEEDDEYEIDVLSPVEKDKKTPADVLAYITEEDLKDEVYEFDVITPVETKSENLLSYPVPTEEEDEMMSYGETEEKTEISEIEKKVEEQELMDILEHYPAQVQKIDIDMENIPYEKEKETSSLDLTGIELSPPGEVFCGIQGVEIEQKNETAEEPGISLEFSTPFHMKNTMENRGVSLDFSSMFEEEKEESNMQISSLIIDDFSEEKQKDLSGKKSSEEKKKVKKKTKKKEDKDDIEVNKKKKVKKVSKAGKEEEH